MDEASLGGNPHHGIRYRSTTRLLSLLYDSPNSLATVPGACLAHNPAAASQSSSALIPLACSFSMSQSVLLPQQARMRRHDPYPIHFVPSSGNLPSIIRLPLNLSYAFTDRQARFPEGHFLSVYDGYHPSYCPVWSLGSIILQEVKRWLFSRCLSGGIGWPHPTVTNRATDFGK